MSAFLTNKHIDFGIGFFMIAGDISHFSDSLYPPIEVFLFDTVVKVKFKRDYGWILKKEFKVGLNSDDNLKGS